MGAARPGCAARAARCCEPKGWFEVSLPNDVNSAKYIQRLVNSGVL